MNDKKNTDNKGNQQVTKKRDNNQRINEEVNSDEIKKRKKDDFLWSLSKLVILGFLAAVFIFRVPALVDPIEKVLSSDTFTVTLGQYKLTAFKLLQDIVVIVMLFWMASKLERFLVYLLKRSTRLKPSARNMIAKVSQVVVFVITFFIAMDLVGVDMGSMNVLSGTIGLGLGFGLQKIASNFISGLILTFEKSINEGDIIELADGTTGVVEEAGARYTRISTFDGRAIMVPNEDFITNPVINWTYENTRARGQLNIAVSFESDIEEAREIILQASNEHPGLSKVTAPICNLEDFGDNSVNFSLQIWVDDIRDGLKGPASDIQFRIWTEFRKRGIKMPAPMREVFVEPELIVDET